jgi:hypothetical protein
MGATIGLAVKKVSGSPNINGFREEINVIPKITKIKGRVSFTKNVGKNLILSMLV